MSESEKDASLSVAATSMYILDQGNGSKILVFIGYRCTNIEAASVYRNIYIYTLAGPAPVFYARLVGAHLYELTRPWRAHHHLAPVTSFDLPLLLVLSFSRSLGLSLSILDDIHQGTSAPVRIVYGGRRRAQKPPIDGGGNGGGRRRKRDTTCITRSLITIDINNQSNNNSNGV